MATTINAGRVRFVSRGTYNNSTQYYLFDLVDYNGSSYIAKENSLGNLPTNTQYWQLIAEKGNTGNTGQTGPVGATGNGIQSITKTATSGLVDTYTITYTNGNTTTFTVTNGEDANTTDISKIKEEITALQTENSRLKGITNALPKISGEDTSLTLTNTANAPLSDIILKGNTSQQQYSGKNLVPITAKSLERNGVTFTINNNQLTINGTATKYILFFLNNEIWSYSANNPILEAGTYNLSFNNEIKFSDVGGMAITIYNENSEIIYEKIGIKNNFSFSISEKGSCTIRMVITKGQVFDNNDLQFQIEQGSTATDYEPYVGGTASPNPDYPQDIKVVTGNNTIKISNKNLLNGTHQTTITANGITITSNSDETFDITGISTSETSFGLITNIDQSNLVVGKTYYFYMSEKYNSTNLNVSLITNTPSLSYWIANNAHTIEENQKYNNIILYVPKGVTMNYHNIKFMINEGSTAIDYVPNKQQVFPISLGSLELCKIGNYQDYFYKSGSIWYLHKEINKITSYNGETITTSYISTTGKLSTGAKVYYVVTPTDTKITDTTLISQLNELEKAVSYDDTTNISQTNANLPFIINAEAFKKIS